MMRLFLLILGTLGGAVLMACDEIPPDLKSRTIEVASETFVVPEEWKYWRYHTAINANEESYNQLQFSLNIDNWSNVATRTNRDVLNQVHVELRPLRSEFGEVHDWTPRDSVHKTTPQNCSHVKIDDTGYVFCDHGSEYRLVGWGQHFYSLRYNGAKEYLSIIGCSAREKTDKLVPVCNARTRFLGNLQLEYAYKKLNFERAIEIDHQLHKIIANMYKENTGITGR